MKKLTESDVIGLMRETWEKKINALVNELDTQFKQHDGEKKTAVSQGLKVRHDESGLLYTVDSIGVKDVVLINPDGERITVSLQELDKNYRVD